jgi:tRNA U34 2-thiouridine synthase MnmA/TrmU
MINKDTAHLRVHDDHIEKPALGQSCVLYNQDACIGGAIIDGVS